MKSFKKIFIGALVVFSFFIITSPVLATTHSFSISATGGAGVFNGTEEINPTEYYPGTTMNLWGSMGAVAFASTPNPYGSMKATVNGIEKYIIPSSVLLLNVVVNGSNQFTVPSTVGSYTAHFVETTTTDNEVTGTSEYYFPYTVVPRPRLNVSVTKAPSYINSGQTSTITWNATGATSITCNSGGNGTGPSGSFTTPELTSNTTYNVTCSAPGYITATGSTTVVVNQINLAVHFQIQGVTSSHPLNIPKPTYQFNFSSSSLTFSKEGVISKTRDG